MKNKKCHNCSSDMRANVQPRHRYTECGLDFVTLANVPVFECPACGAHQLRIRAIEQLHKAIADAVVHKPSRLTPPEVKFLRKYLGLSNQDLAKTMGVSPEQTSRWTSNEPIGTSADRLLRVLVLGLQPAEEYPIKWLQSITDERGKVEPIELTSRRSQWEPVHPPHEIQP
jgi:putative zinc finger/helix-turn-helix YgiT family protein